MTRVDTFFDGRDIYEQNGLYYITKDGEIISPAFVSLKDAWKYQ